MMLTVGTQHIHSRPERLQVQFSQLGWSICSTLSPKSQAPSLPSEHTSFPQNISSMKCLTSTLSTRGDENLTWDQIKGTFMVGIVGLSLLPSWERLACNMRNWERKMQNSAAGATLPASSVQGGHSPLDLEIL